MSTPVRPDVALGSVTAAEATGLERDAIGFWGVFAQGLAAAAPSVAVAVVPYSLFVAAGKGAAWAVLVGLVISWIVAAIGAVIAVVFGFLWARDVTRDVRDEVPAIEPETRAVADAPSVASAAKADAPLPTYTRSRFLEASIKSAAAAEDT